ncbi:MAG: pnbA, partial [Deltaproteobacteria bacterium]|nr:pnbA [Deltaproteobacteria bacterium]
MKLVVDTMAGKVRGAERGGISTWRGIPFGHAPRFAAPRLPAPWSGERDATHFAPVAIQSRDPRAAAMSGITDKIVTSEDCLVVNVYSPGADGKHRPVVVWIHGGAFIMGSGSQPLYNGTSFALHHDVVVVTLNYRLGVLGFLYFGDLLGDAYAEGNYALLDQIAALRWVRDNIAAFGGDPDAVTVMGESAGAVSVATLLAMPAAQGLFHRAILQSGASGLSPPTRTDATEVTRGVLDQLGVDARTAVELPVEQLLAAQEHISRARGLGAFAPYIDGVTVPRRPIEILRGRAGAGVPLLLGSNRDEWALFDVFFGAAATDGVKAQLRGMLGAEADRLHAAYRESRVDRDDHLAWVDLVGDVAFRIPMIRLAEVTARDAAVWMYRFDWATPAFDGRLGAAHALELPFVWNTVELPVSQFLLAGDVVGALPLATAMHAAWASFIRTGDPNPPAPSAAIPAWPRYDVDRRATMLLDRSSRVVDDPG